MRSFDEIYALAVARKGEASVLESLQHPKPKAEIAAMPDDRFLALMTKCIFQSGFNWKVVDAMWPGFEAAFDGFDIGQAANGPQGPEHGLRRDRTHGHGFTPRPARWCAPPRPSVCSRCGSGPRCPGG